MLWVQIVIQKEGIVGIVLEKLLSLFYVVCYVDEVALEPSGKPLVPSLIIIQKKNPNWMALSVFNAET